MISKFFFFVDGRTSCIRDLLASCIFFLMLPNLASAVVVQYELEGHFETTYTRQTDLKFPTKIEQTVTMGINRGDLIMSVDYDTGVTTITGSSTLCIDDCRNLRYFHEGYWGYGRGQVELDWDFTAQDPQVGSITDDGGINYGMQHVGYMRSDRSIFPKIRLELKENPDLGFAWRLSPTEVEGKFDIDTWLLMANRWIGNLRVESYERELAFNASLSAWIVGGTEPPSPPGEEVPEPMTLTLLGSALLGLNQTRKKKI